MNYTNVNIKIQEYKQYMKKIERNCIESIRNKKVYCYGAGKVFKDFLCTYPDIKVSAVIDKNLQHETYISSCSGIKIPIISADVFASSVDSESVLLITCFDYQEVEKELSQYAELQNLPYCIYCQINEGYGNNVINSIGKFQITEFRLQDFNAGHKAPSDVASIALHNGYKVLSVVRGTVKNGKEQTKSEWNKVCNQITNNSTVIIQLPLADISGGIYKLIKQKKEKNIKVIAVVHDIEILRRNVNDNYVEQYNMIKTCADIWIVHNVRMKEALIAQGFDAKRIISLKIFDYLINNQIDIKVDDGIIIAGNLDISKSEYIYKLKQLNGVRFNLFGANYSDNSKYDNVNYFGAYLPDELIKNLQGRYGLVWDGNSLDTCNGLTGEYLKINNPHKLSLYLAVGLPVVIWDEAAEAEFVLKENVGFTVKSLYDLPEKLADISDNDYQIMKKNAEMVGKRLRNGEYMTMALKKAEEKIQEIRDGENIQ